MSRLKRLECVFDEMPVYFITACTERRRPLLANDAIHEEFSAFCQHARSHGAYVGRYVIMPDHIHLFVCLSSGSVGLSMWIKSLKNRLSKFWRAEGIDVPHWQKGFFDHLIRSEESYAEKWKYVRDNPVRAGLVKSSSDWPYAGEICRDACSGGL